MNYLNYMCNMTGYQPFTTIWEDFTIAEEFGAAAIETLYTQLFEKYKTVFVDPDSELVGKLLIDG